MVSAANQYVEHVPILLTVTRRNDTQETIKGNRQLRRAGFLLVFLKSPDKEKHKLDYSRGYGWHGPGPVPRDIHPGEVLTHRILVPHDDVSQPGRYQLWALLQDWDRGSEVKSQPVEVTVLPLPSREQKAASFLRKHNLFRLLSLNWTPRDLVDDDRRHMDEFLTSGFGDSIFLPFVKAKRGELLVRDNLGTVSRRAEEFRRGLQLLEEAAETKGFAQAPQALIKLGRTYKLEKKAAKARAAFERVVSGWPKSPEAAVARANIAAIERVPDR